MKTTITPSKADAAYEALSTERDKLMNLLLEIELRISKVLINAPSSSGIVAEPSTPTKGFAANESPSNMPTPKARREVDDQRSPATPAVAFASTTGRNRSATKLQFNVPDDQSVQVTAAPFNNEDDSLLTSKCKPSKYHVGSNESVWDSDYITDGILKLYKHENGHTQIVIRMKYSGIVKLNLTVKENVRLMEKVLHTQNPKPGSIQKGSVYFIAIDESGGMYRYRLKVDADQLDGLFDKLVELGAKVK